MEQQRYTPSPGMRSEQQLSPQRERQQWIEQQHAAQEELRQAQAIVDAELQQVQAQQQQQQAWQAATMSFRQAQQQLPQQQPEVRR